MLKFYTLFIKFLRKTFLIFSFTQSSSFPVPAVGDNLSDIPARTQLV